jgi:hypothetical protein
MKWQSPNFDVTGKVIQSYKTIVYCKVKSYYTWVKHCIFFCSSFWQNVGSFLTFGLVAIFGYFCKCFHLI